MTRVGREKTKREGGRGRRRREKKKVDMDGERGGRKMITDRKARMRGKEALDQREVE